MTQKHRVVLNTSIFPVSQDIIWEELQKLHTLQFIAYPFAVFTPLHKTESFIWQEGKTFQFHLKLFCLIPLGIHTIHIIQFKELSHKVYTQEVNRYVPVWNHKIYLKPINSKQTQYTDEVEIYAGWKTFFVYIWAKLFYSHRQKKWIKLLKSKKNKI